VTKNDWSEAMSNGWLHLTCKLGANSLHILATTDQSTATNLGHRHFIATDITAIFFASFFDNHFDAPS
jgi:hypothetical protein